MLPEFAVCALWRVSTSLEGSWGGRNDPHWTVGLAEAAPGAATEHGSEGPVPTKRGGTGRQAEVSSGLSFESPLLPGFLHSEPVMRVAALIVPEFLPLSWRITLDFW